MRLLPLCMLGGFPTQSLDQHCNVSAADYGFDPLFMLSLFQNKSALLLKLTSPKTNKSILKLHFKNFQLVRMYRMILIYLAWILKGHLSHKIMYSNVYSSLHETVHGVPL